MNDSVRTSSPSGVRETFLALYSLESHSFAEAAEELMMRFLRFAEGSEPILLRFHLSDITNQKEWICRLLKTHQLDTVSSLVGQAPVNGAEIALEAWLFPKLSGRHSLRILRNVFSGRSGSFDQMRAEFESLADSLGPSGNVSGNVLRTWIYCRDIDNNYAGLVRARKEYFDGIGLTARTHYIASTGIEGQSEVPERLVRMDSLCAFDLLPGQVEFMHAPDFLPPTHTYGVTFERGTKFITGDRSHFFLSGTASIDRNGEIVHAGDPSAQARRMLENAEALLKNHGASLDDLKQAVVYFRNPVDFRRVRDLLEERFGAHCVWLALHAPVCRPGWLLEMEGIAVRNGGNSEFRILK